MQVLGLDIGGANLKAAHQDGTASLVLYYARHYDEALEECEKLLEIEPNALLPVFVKGAVHTARGNWANRL